MTDNYIYEFLIRLGYNPKESGDYFRCAALYRNGDNQSSLSVSKKTGAWSDFPQGISNQPFSKLIKLTTGENNEEILNDFLNNRSDYIFVETSKKSDYMKDDFFAPDCLDKLINLYNFYEERGITKETQNAYLCGFASSGKMYGRITFPIFDEQFNIIGFTGRYVYPLKGKIPKWLIIGKKKEFVYPYFLPKMKESFHEDFDKKREVILVESIGDSMALYQNGFKNNLVCFGLQGSNVLGILNRLNPDRIIISFNNDSSSDKNRGLLGAIRTYLGLRQFFGDERAYIKLPEMNDFGEMALSKDASFLFEKWRNKKINLVTQKKAICKIIEDDMLLDKCERYFSNKEYNYWEIIKNE